MVVASDIVMSSLERSALSYPSKHEAGPLLGLGAFCPIHISEAL